MQLYTEEAQRQQEAYARLTTPYHVTESRFSQHVAVQGIYEGEELLDGYDRLLKLESQFGVIQMGYAPSEGKTFVFTHAKRSPFGVRSAQAKQYNHPHHNALFYQGTAKPWSVRGLRRQMQGDDAAAPSMRWIAAQVQGQESHQPQAYASLFPFAQRTEEVGRRMILAEQKRENNIRMREIVTQEGDPQEIQQTLHALRAGQLQIEQEREQLAAILYRKDAQSLWFFRQVNAAFDVQKQEIFAYYKTENQQTPEETTQAATNDTEQDDEDVEDI